MAATRVPAQLRSKQDSILIFVPVYRQDFTVGTATVENRRLALRGFVVGLYEIRAIFAALAQAAETRGLLFRVSDIHPGEPDQVLMSTLPATAAPNWRKEIAFAGRTW